MNEGNGRMLTLKKVGETIGYRNELKRATENAKKEYFENIREEIMEFQRTGRYDIDVHEDKRTRFEGDARDAKY